MNLQPFEETKQVAKIKWREYSEAAKKSKEKLYVDLRKAYNQLKQGRKIIDINKVIQAGGVHENFYPKLAIARATTKNVNCRVFQSGDIEFINDDPRRWNWSANTTDVVIKKCFPEIPIDKDKFPYLYPAEYRLSAPVPLIPPHCLPENLTSDYYVLWEVDEWKKVPPVDPYLLRRITPNFFVVVAGWNLSELERAAMAGRMI